MARRNCQRADSRDHDEDTPDEPLVPWKVTKIMNARDLARDDDFLSHIFIEKLGATGVGQQLLVHRMDPRRRLPKTDTAAVHAIVQRLIATRPFGPQAIKQAVNEFLELDGVLYFIRDFCSNQINAFATHASRYLELYMPSGSIEIAQTSRYSRITGKNELCILTTRAMPVNALINELKGSLAELTDEEDHDLKKSDTRGGSEGGMRRDFSVIHSKQLKKNHLFLGPARFVNHDCDNNVELFRDGRYITFRTIKPIAMGQELTAHYGNGYFGKNNRHCLCETCERRGRGGYAPQTEGEGKEGDADGSESESEYSVAAEVEAEEEQVNVNERRTRRGVYRVVQDENSDEDEEATSTLAVSKEDVKEESITTRTRRSFKDDALAENSTFKSVITTRGQKLRETSSVSASIPSRNSREPSVSSSVLPRQSSRLRRAESDSMADSALHKLKGGLRKSPLFDVSGLKSNDKGRANEKDAPTAKVRPPGPNCMTCWGPLQPEEIEDFMAKTKGKGKGKAKPIEKNCFRCARHLLIYSAPWPQRVPTPGSRDSDTRESTPIDSTSRVSRSSLQAVDRKLKAARLAQLKLERDKKEAKEAEKRRLEAEEKEKEEAEKKKLERKRKREESLEKARVAKRIKASGSSANASTSKMTAISETVLNETASTSEGRRMRSGRFSATTPISITRRKRSKAGEEQVKVEEEENVSLSLTPDKAATQSSSTPNDMVSERARSRSPGRAPMDENGDERRDKNFFAADPHPAGYNLKRTGLLGIRPNPVQVSRFRPSVSHSDSSFGSDSGYASGSPSNSQPKGGSTPNLVEDDTDETGTSDENPATPEVFERTIPKPVIKDRSLSDSPPVRSSLLYDPIRDSIVRDEVEKLGIEEDPSVENGSDKLKVPVLKGLGLNTKPNPIALSKRVWSPQALLADVDDDMGIVQTFSRSTSVSAPSSKRTCAIYPHVQSEDSTECEQQEVDLLNFKNSVKRGRFDIDIIEISSDEEDAATSKDLHSASFRLRAVDNRLRSTSASSSKTTLQPAAEITKHDIQRSQTASSQGLLTSPSISPSTTSHLDSRQTHDPICTPTQSYQQPRSRSSSNSTSASANILTTSPSLAKILNPPLPGAFKSSFFPASPSTPNSKPYLVKAGWEYESD